MQERVFFLFFFSLFSIFCRAQIADTIVEYEYVYETDTIWVDGDVQENEFLEFSLFDSKKIQNVSSEAATISENLIFLKENQKETEMKKNAFLGLTFLALNSNVKAQSEFKENLSFFVKGNFATQVHSYPSIATMDNVQLTTKDGNRNFLSEEEYGKTVEPYLISPGIGIASKFSINRFISFIPKVSYLQKGCKDPLEYGTRLYDSNNDRYYESIINEKNVQNRFHTVSLDFIFQFSKENYKKIQPSFYMGLRGDLLLWKNIEFDIDQVNHNNSGYTNFNRFNYGFIGGVGLEFNRKWYVQFEMNNDLSFLVKSDILKVKNQIFSMNVGIYLNKISKYKLVKKE